MEGEAAVLLTGVYGVGKSSMAAEMATILERAEVPYAAIDLDWLAWANVQDAHGSAGLRVMLRNLGAVVATYRDGGIRRFVLAGTVDEADEVEAIRDVLGMPLTVARLVVPIEAIERRLSSDPTSGRRDDLEVARRSLLDGTGAGIGDLVVENTRPIGRVASEILDWLGWLRDGADR